MTRARSLVALAAALAVIAALSWWLFPSNARRIRSRFHTLAALASAPATEQDLERIARAGRFGRMLAADIAVTFEDGTAEIDGRETIALLVAQRPVVRGGVKIELDEVGVDVATSGDRATSSAVARATCQDPQTNRPVIENRQVMVNWRKVDGEWVVASAHIGGPAT